MAITIMPIDAPLGAVVTNVALADLDDDTWEEIHAAFLTYCVLVFPGQHLDDDAQGRFAARFGKLEQMQRMALRVRSHVQIPNCHINLLGTFRAQD